MYPWCKQILQWVDSKEQRDEGQERKYGIAQRSSSSKGETVGLNPSPAVRWKDKFWNGLSNLVWVMLSCLPVDPSYFQVFRYFESYSIKIFPFYLYAICCLSWIVSVYLLCSLKSIHNGTVVRFESEKNCFCRAVWNLLWITPHHKMFSKVLKMALYNHLAGNPTCVSGVCVRVGTLEANYLHMLTW